MKNIDEISDAEILQVLHRFSDTDPAMQRRIVFQLIQDRDELMKACKAAASSAGKDWLQMQLMLAKVIQQVQTKSEKE